MTGKWAGAGMNRKKKTLEVYIGRWELERIS
jgi:hypothetical protein